MTISALEFHTGIEPTEHGDQYIATCPFCDKPDKFYFNNDFLWDCKNTLCIDPTTRKTRSGNLVTFLRQVYEEHDTVTKAAQMIATARGLPPGRVSQLGLKYNPWNDSIMIPTTKNGKINNLYKAVQTQGKWNILCTPSMEHTLMNWPEDPHETIWICEGHWDRIAGEAITSNNGQITCIGVPGAGVWKKSWTDVLIDRNVVFCYDNDNSGRVGFEKVISKHIATHPQKPKSVSYVDWKDVKDKYDLNDAYKEHGRKAFEYIQSQIKPFTVPEGTVIVKTTIESVQPNLSIDSFDKFLDTFRETFHTTQDMELCLLLVLTSVYSIGVGGEQLWLRIIGPPGCGKTTVAKAISSSEQVVLRSTFTGLFSGFNDGTGTDQSLVPIISGKALIVKDADALLQQANIARIFSELRDFYDKDSSTGYRHGFNHDYRNIPSAMILCGTNVLRRADQAFLGERFLDFEMRISHHDEELISQRMLERSMALAADPSNLPPEIHVQAAAKGFIDHHLSTRPMTTSLSLTMQKEILKLAKLTAKMRTKVDRDTFGKGDITFSPVAELPTRLIGQLSKMCLCVPTILGRDDDNLNKKLLRKVVKDIINPTSNRYRICQDLMEGWYGREELMESTGMSKSTATRELDDLRVLRLVDEKLGPSAIPKHKRLVFTLRDDIKEGIMAVNHE
jgi:hypothetical protein